MKRDGERIRKTVCKHIPAYSDTSGQESKPRGDEGGAHGGSGSRQKSVTDLKSELTGLRDTLLKNSTPACGYGPEVSGLSGAITDQEAKLASLESFVQGCGTFAEEAALTDSGAARLINRRKNEFYGRYPYLTPDSELSFLELPARWITDAAGWCAEHWKRFLTSVAVILAAAFIAGLANLVSLILLVADMVCYAAAEILDGISAGCDIVSVLLPLMSIAKSVAQIGVRAFCRAAVAAVKKAFKETVTQVFRSGLRNGIRNAGRILFRTFIFDIDDFTKVVNGKRVLDMREPKLIPGEVTPYYTWTREGDRLYPTDSIPKSRRLNPECLTMKEMMDRFGVDSLPCDKHGNVVDFSSISLYSVEIDDFTGLRKNSSGMTGNMEKADAVLKREIGVTREQLIKELGVKLTWNDNKNMRSMDLVPTSQFYYE